MGGQGDEADVTVRDPKIVKAGNRQHGITPTAVRRCVLAVLSPRASAFQQFAWRDVCFPTDATTADCCEHTVNAVQQKTCVRGTTSLDSATNHAFVKGTVGRLL